MPSFTHQNEDTRTGAPAMEFPSAPEEWTPAKARDQAAEENLTLTTDHWVVISALQAYYAKTEEIDRNMREMHDMLEERFHAKGGIKYLYELLPGGPIAQGCRLAGLKAPAIAVDKGFGSVA
jgi:tRNA 2-thiouridine synthesizing protein E